jgi:hypothetical protein
MLRYIGQLPLVCKRMQRTVYMHVLLSISAITDSSLMALFIVDCRRHTAVYNTAIYALVGWSSGLNDSNWTLKPVQTGLS